MEEREREKGENFEYSLRDRLTTFSYKYNKDWYHDLSTMGLSTNKAHNCKKCFCPVDNVLKCKIKKKLKTFGEGSRENKAISKMAEHNSWEEQE